MAIARMFLPLLILAGLALFALQNWSPVLPLVILGLRTQAFPLAIWMIGAIAAGAATTVAVSTLFSLSKFTAVRRSNKNRQPASPYAPPTERTESRPWAGAWGKGKGNDSPRNPETRLQDDWENRQPLEEWDDWDDDAPRNAQPGRDRTDEDWDNWEGYEPKDRVQAPVRTDFEVKQEPAAQKQSGSIYSFSYDKPEEPRKDEVYDADYRVIVPPVADSKVPEPPELDDEDWGFEDDDREGDGRGDRRPQKR
jgi:uncharacterized integral membrane protein